MLGRRAACVGLVSVLLLSACGGGDDDGSGEAQQTGGDIRLEAVSGDIQVQRPGEDAPSRLQEEAQVPPGTLVDASNGLVRLTSPTAGGGTQSGEFSEGAFELGQDEDSDVVTLKLAGGDAAKCETEAARNDRSQVGGPEIRRLFTDAKGQFRTEGGFGSAAIRGTKFLTVDACFGTLNRVEEGNVLVEDFTSGKQVEVAAGEEFWAADRTRSKPGTSEAGKSYDGAAVPGTGYDKGTPPGQDSDPGASPGQGYQAPSGGY